MRKLDRDVMAAARAVRKFRVARERGHAGVDPWIDHRGVARKSLYAELAQLEVVRHERELKDALLGWVAWLTMMRVSADAEDALFEEMHAPNLEIRLEKTVRVSWHSAWSKLIEAPNAVYARVYFAAISAAGERIAPRAKEVSQVRQEALARLFGATTLLGLEDDAVATRWSTSLLASTNDLARDLCAHARKQFPDPRPLGLDVLLAPRAVEGWPAHLGSRWLDELFGAHTKGLTIDLDLPLASSPASFVRALGAFGGAYRMACCGPSALARGPRFADVHRFSGTLATLGASEVFFRRALGLAPGRARDQSREIAAALLLSLRLACATWLVSDGRIDHAQAGPDGELPRALLGAWPLARDDQGARVLGFLSAATLASELRDRHDEDWWKNPRAWADLRSGSIQPISRDVELPRQVVRALEESLS